MKKLMLTMAAAVAGITLATAQTPTYDTARRQPASQTVKPTPQRQETVQPSRSHSSQEANYQRDMVKIQASDVPTELRSTLDGAEYKGWESGTFYRNKTNDGYLLEINNGSNVKTYRFDKSGKRLQTNSTIPQQ